MGDSITDALDEKTDDPPAQPITVETEAVAMPSLGDQLDMAGAGDMSMRMQAGSFDHPETGEPLGEILFGMDGTVWIEYVDGSRVRYDLQSLVQAANDAIEQSDFGTDDVFSLAEPGEDDEDGAGGGEESVEESGEDEQGE